MGDDFVAPAYSSLPDLSCTLGDEAAELAESCGVGVDPEQKLALDAVFAVNQNTGRWATFEQAVVGPRQNIKTHLKKIVALTHAAVLDTRLVMWSAHEFETALASQSDLIEIIERVPWLNRRCTDIRTGNNRPGIEFDNRLWIRFKARTKTGARGLTAPCLLLDEAFALTSEHVGSLMPTMSALSQVGNPHILYGSSAGMLHSGVLRSLRDRGRAGDKTLTYLEWCDDQPQDVCEVEHCTHVYGTPGCVLDDESRWHAANLALGRRISVDFVRMERRSLDPAEFARERMGWWDEPVAEDELLADDWAACADRTAELTSPPVLGVGVDHGQMSASITAYGGAFHVAEHHPGTAWIVTKLLARLEQHPDALVALLGDTGPDRALIPTLEKPVAEGGAGLTVRSKKNPQGRLVVLDGPDVVNACEAFLRGVLEHELVHRDEQLLNAAFAGAGRRQVGDSWRWSRRDSTVAISPLTAATAARFVAQQNNPTTAGYYGAD